MDPNIQGQLGLFSFVTTLCFVAATFCAAKIVVTTLQALFFEGTVEAKERLRTIWLPIFIGLALITFAAHYAAHHPLS